MVSQVVEDNSLLSYRGEIPIVGSNPTPYACDMLKIALHNIVC